MTELWLTHSNRVMCTRCTTMLHIVVNCRIFPTPESRTRECDACGDEPMEEMQLFSDQPAELVTALNTALEECSALVRKSKTNNLAYAISYLAATPRALHAYGRDGLGPQLLYALNNMSGWRGDRARDVKTILRRYART